MFEEIDKQYTQAKAHRKELEVKHAKVLRSLDMEIVKLRIERQKWCTHPTTRKEDTFDYHKREDWTTVYCTVCDKQLERY